MKINFGVLGLVILALIFGGTVLTSELLGEVSNTAAAIMGVVGFALIFLGYKWQKSLSDKGH